MHALVTKMYSIMPYYRLCQPLNEVGCVSYFTQIQQVETTFDLNSHIYKFRLNNFLVIGWTMHVGAMNSNQIDLKPLQD